MPLKLNTFVCVCVCLLPASKTDRRVHTRASQCVCAIIIQRGGTCEIRAMWCNRLVVCVCARWCACVYEHVSDKQCKGLCLRTCDDFAPHDAVRIAGAAPVCERVHLHIMRIAEPAHNMCEYQVQSHAHRRTLTVPEHSRTRTTYNPSQTLTINK